MGSMSEIIKIAAVSLGCLALVTALSIGFGYAGDPQSRWLWHDVFGLIP